MDCDDLPSMSESVGYISASGKSVGSVGTAAVVGQSSSSSPLKQSLVPSHCLLLEMHSPFSQVYSSSEHAAHMYWCAYVLCANYVIFVSFASFFVCFWFWFICFERNMQTFKKKLEFCLEHNFNKIKLFSGLLQWKNNRSQNSITANNCSNYHLRTTIMHAYSNKEN